MMGEPPKRVVVGVSGSLANSAALHVAVAQARQQRAELLAVRAWTPVGGEITYRRGPCPPLMEVWRAQAGTALLDAFAEAMGGLPPDLSVRCLISRSDTGPALVDAADRPGDLLVVGVGRQGPLARLQRRSVSRFCLQHSRCPVLAVPPPAMLRDLRPDGLPARRSEHRIGPGSRAAPWSPQSPSARKRDEP